MAEEKLYISKITLPDGHTYEVKDLEARGLIEQLEHIGLKFVRSIDAATTPLGVVWHDGETTIVGTLPPSEDIKNIYLVPEGVESGDSAYIEYVCVIIGKDAQDKDIFAWEAIGSTDVSLDELGALAYKDSASGSFTVNTADSAAFANGAASVSATYTPQGSINVTLSQTATEASLTKGDYTPAGGVSVTLDQTATAASLTKADYTPAGSVSKPEITVTAPTSKVQVKDESGSVTAGSAASFTRGAFSGGSFTQGTDNFTAPTLTTTVTNETLTIGFSQGSFTQGSDSFTPASHDADTFVANTPTAVTLPTFKDADLVSSVSAELAAAPTFTGTKAENALVTGVSYDKASVQAASFTGTKAENILVTAVSYDKAAVDTKTFTGTEATINSTGTASGDVNLTKTDKTITVTVE